MTSRRLWGAIVLSLLIHFLFAFGLDHVPASWDHKSEMPPLTEIDLIEKPVSKMTSDNFVRQVEPPKDLLDDQSNENARFLSENRQRVLQETQARKTGLTRNGHTLPANSWLKMMKQQLQQESTQRQQQKDANQTPPERERSPDGYRHIPLPHGRAIAFEDAPSTIGEVVPDDVALGDFTALNTDRFKYYSFYARIEELVRFRWEHMLQEAVESFEPAYLRKVIGRRTWITQVEFLLTPDGHYKSAIVHTQSGVARFDRAAVESFHDAGVFPNPPQEMVSGDGLIHIEYSFNVRWSPEAMVDDR